MLTETPFRGVRDRVLLLRSMPTFAALDDEGLTLMAEHASSRHFGAGETVLAEGKPVTRVYLVVSGQITSHRRGVRIGVVGRGRGVGFLSILARDPKGVHAVADVDTQTLEFPVETFENALEENFSLTRNLLRVSAAEVVRKRGNLPARPDKAPPLVLGEYRDRPRTLVERIIVLSSQGIFADCNIDALIAVARRTQELRVPAGEIFWRVGDAASFWLRLEHGHIRCTAEGDAFVDVGSGFVLGIMDALGQVARSYEARAETPILATRTDLEPFLGVVETHFDLARHFLALMARSLLEMPSVA